MKMSSDDLRELALDKGIIVTIDGKKFNADKTKVKKPKKDLLVSKVGADAEPKPVSAPSKSTATPVAAPTVVPPVVNITVDMDKFSADITAAIKAQKPERITEAPVVNVTVDMDKFSADNTAVLKAIKAVVKTRKLKKITEWKFEIKRGSQGFIESVTAKAI